MTSHNLVKGILVSVLIHGMLLVGLFFFKADSVDKPEKDSLVRLRVQERPQKGVGGGTEAQGAGIAGESSAPAQKALLHRKSLIKGGFDSAWKAKAGATNKRRYKRRDIKTGNPKTSVG